MKPPSPPQSPQSLLAAAGLSLQEGRLDEAKAAYKTLIATHPDIAELHVHLGVVQRRQNHREQAADCFRRAIEINPKMIGAHYNLANTLVDLGHFSEAETAYRSALEENPAFDDAANNLGDLLCRMERFDEARAVLEAAIKLTPDRAELHNTLGNILKALGELVAARTHLGQACTLSPSNPIFHKNLGTVHQALNDGPEALASFDLAIELSPKDADAHCLRAFCLLGLGEFKDGWKAYDWRWHSSEQEPKRDFQIPYWDGSALAGKKILMWGEQGIGDEIMFSTMIPDFLEQASGVMIECRARLCDLFKRSFPDARIIARTDPPSPEIPGFLADVQAPAGSLARSLRTARSTFLARPPLLQADPERVREIRKRYQSQYPGKTLVGISWRSEAKDTGSRRSIELNDWASVLEQPGVQFINLQYGDVDGELATFEDIHGISIHNDKSIDPLESLDSFAAQCAALDLIISVANTTIHVAGALGVPTWNVLTHVSDWRWMMGGDQSLWYPSVELFRQPRRGDWASVIKSIEGRLSRFRHNPLHGAK